MTIQLNGDRYEVAGPLTITALLAHLNIDPRLVAVEHNVEVVKRGFDHFVATGEPHWESFHWEVEVHDHDTLDQGDYRGRAGVGRWLADWTAAWSEFSMEPEAVAEAGIRGMFSGKTEIIPGLLNQIGAFSNRIMPKALVEKVAAGIYVKKEK